jgi:signal transduction histidine kinase/DNA-binding response OmpR family regulator
MISVPEQMDLEASSARCRGVTRIFGAFIALSTVILLIGWAVASDRMETWSTWEPPAFLFLLAGGALFLLTRQAPVASSRWIVWAIAAALLLIGLQNVIALFLWKSTGSTDPTLEHLLARREAPLSMSPLTGLTFCLAGLSFFILGANPKPPQLRTAANLAALLLGLVNFVVFIPFLQGDHLLDWYLPHPAAWTTTVLGLALSAGLISAAGPMAWPLRPLCGTSNRARLLRAFLAPLIALVVLSTVLRTMVVRPVFLALGGQMLTKGSPRGDTVTAIGVLFVVLTIAAGWLIVAYISKYFARELDYAEEKREKAIEAERRARDAAEEANTAKSQFLASMSHELRTPLNAIIGYSEMLVEQAQDEGQEDFVPDLHKIHAAGKHLLSLINDILDLSKIEAGKVELSLENFDLTKVIEETVTTIRPLVEKKGNVLKVDCAADLGVVHADMIRVRQVLFNLLSNAGKFTEQGTVSIDATRQPVKGQDWITIRVSDTGIGMTPEQLNKIFQAFTQADASTTRKYGGTGLGLAISLKLGQMMGGTINVESESGKGSTFTFRIPAVVKKPGTAMPAAPAPKAPPLPAKGPKPGQQTILVADDDPAVCDLLDRYLTAEGFYVVCVTRGEDVIAMAKKVRPRAITLDVMMPGMDGWSVLAAIKKEPSLADVPVVMVTIVDDRNLGFAMGAAGYLVKPVDRDGILHVLKKCCLVGHAPVALVIEDDEPTREMFRRMLEKDGWAVVEASNGRQALEFVAASPPSLIMLDLLMPEMDGFEFLSELRQHPEWKSIPVVVVTSKDLSPEDRMFLNGSLLLSNCVRRVMQKGSFNRDELLREVHALVSQKS